MIKVLDQFVRFERRGPRVYSTVLEWMIPEKRRSGWWSQARQDSDLAGSASHRLSFGLIALVLRSLVTRFGGNEVNAARSKNSRGVLVRPSALQGARACPLGYRTPFPAIA
jgi:hypothetical protein